MADSLECGHLTAVILAGGLGSRLSSVVTECPKVLAPVNERSFLSYLLDQLEEAGLKHVILSTGYLGEQVEQAFGKQYGSLNLIYSREREPLGTGGALRLALPLVDRDPVLVMNGDSYCDVDLCQFLAWQQAHRAENSLLVTQVHDTLRFGRVWLDPDGLIARFEEKEDRLKTGINSREPDESGAGWISAGIYLLSRRLLSSIPPNRAVSIERDVFPAWVERRLWAYRVHDSFLDIGTPESYAAASSFLMNHARFHRLGSTGV